MTIKQNGGIFGRNPTFNDVTVEGEFTSNNLNIDSNKLYVDPNNVRVGINTDSPDTIFEIRGADPILTIRDTDTGSATANATLRLAETGASDTLGAYWDIKADGGDLQFIDSWNEGGGTGTRLVIDDSGDVGIGVSSPSTRLHTDVTGGDNQLRIATTTSGDPTLALYANGAGAHAIAFDRSALALTFKTVGSSERMRISSNGDVGIGTSSPGSRLSIVGLPTSSAGLSAGDVYNDGGTLKIV